MPSLFSDKKSAKLPRHIAVIMDGNGRWAKKRGLPRAFGHKKGVERVKELVLHANDCGLEYLSLYAFSMENWLRPKEEVGVLMTLLEEYIDNELSVMIDNGIRLNVSGRTELLPSVIREKINDAIKRSVNGGGVCLNLCLSYGGRAEIVDACKKIVAAAEQGLNIDELDNDAFGQYLYNPDIPDIDLMIRTSGEQRISNFMLWRAAYSELIFVDKHWPDFSKDDFDEAVKEYAGRTRRFGKTDEQIDVN